MKTLALLLVPLYALASPQQWWVNVTDWPAFGTSTPIHRPDIDVPSAFDRSAMFWLQIFRSSPGTYSTMNSDLFPSFSLTADTFDSRTWGYNTLRLARAHAYDYFSNCINVSEASPTAAHNKTTFLYDCGNSTAPLDVANGRYYAFLSNASANSVVNNLRDYTVVRHGINDRLEFEAGRLAVADMVCRSSTGYSVATHKFGICTSGVVDNRDEIRGSTDTYEVACGGFARTEDGSTAIADYALNCIHVMAIEPDVPPSYDLRGSGEQTILTATHTVDKNGNLLFGISGHIDQLSSLTLQFDGYSISANQGDGPLTWSTFYAAFANGSAALRASAGCIAYRWQACIASTCLYYPGGTSSPNGWLKTYGLGTCQQNYCPCLASEGGCCEEDCYLSASGTICDEYGSEECYSNVTCDGTSPVCAAPATRDGEWCGPAGQPDTECNPHMTCGSGAAAGVCQNNTKGDGDSCTGGDTDCLYSNWCQAGSCVQHQKEDGTVCADNWTEDICHVPDTCQGGTCQYGAGIQNVGSLCGYADTHNCSTQRCDNGGHCSTTYATEGDTCAQVEAKYQADGSASQCWDRFTCPGGSDTCNENWRSTSYVCQQQNQTLHICDHDWVCSGYDETCVTKYRADYESFVCAAGDQCRPAVRCVTGDVDCPAQPPCLTCAAFTTSIACEANPPYYEGGFHGCAWCNDLGGCQNRTDAQDNCGVSVCGGMATNDPHVIASYDDPSRYCPRTKENSASGEIVTLISVVQNYRLRTICFVIDVTSQDNSTTTLDTSLPAHATFAPVLYNISSGDAVLIAASAPVSVPLLDRGMYRVNLTIPESEVWGVGNAEYTGGSFLAGIQFSQACPAFDVVGLLDVLTVVPSYEPAYSISSRASSADTFAQQYDDNIPYIFNIGMDAGACHDGFVEYSEDCDNDDPKAFCAECRCDVERNATIDKSNQGCKCAYDLPTPDAHNFTAPPLIHGLTYDAAANTVSMLLRVPQTAPRRTGVAGNLVNARTGQQTAIPYDVADNTHSSVFKGSDYPCYWEAAKTFDVDDLIENGQPLAYVVEPEGLYYALQFAVEVSWCEEVYMYRTPAQNRTQQRCMSARLAFEIYVQRFLTAQTNVTIIDSSLLWAYIRRGFLVIPADGTSPYFEIEMETLPKTDTIYVESDSFYSVPGSWGGHILWVSNLTELSNNNRYQQWLYRVYFADSAFCALNESDVYQLSYNLISSSTGIASSRQTLQMRLMQGESWCADHVAVEVQGRQRTYPDIDMVFSSASTSMDQYLRGSTIYVAVDISQMNHHVPVENMAVRQVDVYGPSALWNSSYVKNVFLADGSGILWSDPEWQVAPFNCTYGSGASLTPQACYSIVLNNDLLAENKPLTIESRVELLVLARRSSTAAAEARSITSSSRLFVRSPAKQSVADILVVYRVTPAFVAALGVLAAVCALSLFSTVWVIRHRPEHSAL